MAYIGHARRPVRVETPADIEVTWIQGKRPQALPVPFPHQTGT
jgi:hypothetical protein